MIQRLRAMQNIGFVEPGYRTDRIIQVESVKCISNECLALNKYIAKTDWRRCQSVLAMLIVPDVIKMITLNSRAILMSGQQPAPHSGVKKESVLVCNTYFF